MAERLKEEDALRPRAVEAMVKQTSFFKRQDTNTSMVMVEDDEQTRSYFWTIVVGTGDWRRNRVVVWKELCKADFFAAFFMLLGNFCSLMQNEFVIHDLDPNSMPVNTTKFFNLAFSIITVAYIFRIQYLKVLLERLRDHIDKGLALDTAVENRDLIQSKRVVLEVVVCLLHLPPGATFEIPVETVHNIVLYRGETIFCVINSLRMYLLWRLARDYILNGIPKRYTVAQYTGARVNSGFVLRTLLHSWAALIHILFVWCFVIVIMAYWFRSGELTACLFQPTDNEWCNFREAQFWAQENGAESEKVNDVYMWNHLWIIFIFATRGNNEVFRPTTHAGRGVGAITSIAGIVLMAFLTASLGQSLAYTPKESSANLLIQRERARYRTQIQAADIINRWWRRLHNKKLTKKQKGMRRSDVLREFFNTRHTAQIAVDELLGESDKIDRVNLRSKRMEYAIYCVGHAMQVESVLKFYDRESKNVAFELLERPSGENIRLPIVGHLGLGEYPENTKVAEGLGEHPENTSESVAEGLELHPENTSMAEGLGEHENTSVSQENSDHEQERHSKDHKTPKNVPDAQVAPVKTRRVAKIFKDTSGVLERLQKSEMAQKAARGNFFSILKSVKLLEARMQTKAKDKSKP